MLDQSGQLNQTWRSHVTLSPMSPLSPLSPVANQFLDICNSEIQNPTKLYDILRCDDVDIAEDDHVLYVCVLYKRGCC